jgi:hypothetical protein
MEEIMEEVKSSFKNVLTRETEEEKERVDEFFRKIEYNQVTEEENNILTVKLTKEEIQNIRETDNNKYQDLMEYLTNFIRHTSKKSRNI